MNCREAQSEIFANRDGAPGASPRAALDAHVASCAACQQIRTNLAAALGAWRTDSARAIVPDAEREWHAVRRRIRGGAETGLAPVRPSRSGFAWLSLPLGAAAAAAFAFVVLNQERSAELHANFSSAVTARAHDVEAPGHKASTMVFVDDKSGWLIILASDTATAE